MRAIWTLSFALVVAATLDWAVALAAAGSGQQLQLSSPDEPPPRLLLAPNAGRAYELPALPFSYAALEPHIDEATVRVHHSGHQRAYTNNMNALLSQWRAKDETGLSNRSLVEIFANTHALPDALRQKLIDQGGGFVNHLLYWFTLSANPSGERRRPSGTLSAAIDKAFGSFDAFVASFNSSALSLFGSGYVWLVRNKYAELEILSTANQELVFDKSVCPARSEQFCVPLLTIDVWEHAYYLKNKNLRAKYVSSWWQLVDWTRVQQLDEGFSASSVKDWRVSGEE